MVTTSSNDSTISNIRIDSPPYSPSWIDKVTGWIDARPGSALNYYFGFGAVLLLVQVAFLVFEGSWPIKSFSIVHAYMSVAIPSFLALTHYLDNRAAKALESMRSGLNVSDREFVGLKFRLTTLPLGATILSSIIMVGTLFILETIGGEYRPPELFTLPMTANLVRIIYYLGFWIMGAFFYHTLHQLRMINEIYTKYTQVNLFRIKPLYAFSNLSALTAGSIAMITYGWMLVNPDVDLNTPAIFLNVIIFLLVLVTFLWPQLGIHSLQVMEKDRLIEEANRRLEKIIHEIHKSVDGGELSKMTELNMGIMTLEIEIRNLKSIHTWPWQPETVRWLVTALVLPLGLWFVQFLLQRVLGS
jgi:hypothetical protein